MNRKRAALRVLFSAVWQGDKLLGHVLTSPEVLHLPFAKREGVHVEVIATRTLERNKSGSLVVRHLKGLR